MRDGKGRYSPPMRSSITRSRSLGYPFRHPLRHPKGYVSFLKMWIGHNHCPTCSCMTSDRTMTVEHPVHKKLNFSIMSHVPSPFLFFCSKLPLQITFYSVRPYTFVHAMHVCPIAESLRSSELLLFMK